MNNLKREYFNEKTCFLRVKEDLLLESQRRIILKMEELSPGRGWLLDGAHSEKGGNSPRQEKASRVTDQNPIDE